MASMRGPFMLIELTVVDRTVMLCSWPSNSDIRYNTRSLTLHQVQQSPSAQQGSLTMAQILSKRLNLYLRWWFKRLNSLSSTDRLFDVLSFVRRDIAKLYHIMAQWSYANLLSRLPRPYQELHRFKRQYRAFVYSKRIPGRVWPLHSIYELQGRNNLNLK